MQQDFAEHVAVGGHVLQAYFDQVVVFAGHEVAFEDLRDFQHFAAEFFKNIAGFGMQFDFHEHQQAVAQAGGVEAAW